MSGRRTQPTDARPQDLPTKAELARLRVEYGKDERLAFLGHLDLIGTVERCVRRSGLPFSIGNGFARRTRIQFSSALPVGASSACELFDVRLTEPVSADEALERLREATPTALAPVRCAYVDGALPALEAWLNRATWDVELVGAPFGTADLAAGISEVARRGEIVYMRGEREKRVDVSATLVGVERVGESALRLETRSTSTGALRPRVLLDAACAAVGLDQPEAVRVRRVLQRHEAEDGRLVEPFGPFGIEGRAPLS